jgi:hypothetical protein
MERGDFFWFLENSMNLLKRESSANYARLCTELGELRANIAAGAKKRVVFFEGGRFTVSRDVSKYDIEVCLTDRAIVDVIDAKHSLVKALLADAISVKGSLGALEKYRLCLGIYLDGALRSDGFLTLLSDYRQMICRTDPEVGTDV